MKAKKISEGFLADIILCSHFIIFLVIGVVWAIRDEAYCFAIFLVVLIALLISTFQKVDILDDKIQIKSLKGLRFIKYKDVRKIEYRKGTRSKSVAILYENDFGKAKQLGINAMTLTWEDVKEFAIFVKSKNNNVDISEFEN